MKTIISSVSLFLGISSLCNLASAAAVPDYLTNRANYISLISSKVGGWSSKTKFSLAGSEVFNNATERWTSYDAPTFQAAASPATEQDLVKIVKLATRLNIPFLATGGRHGYGTTLDRLNNGLAIDLSQLDSFSLDKATGRFTVGPGLRVGKIFEPLFNAGFDIQTGSAPCPSVVGITIGGGVGRYQGTYGLMIDALISARIITAKGDIVEVSKTQNPDLFWAIRGAGANFGIIVSATYQAHRLTDDGDIFVGYYRVPSGREAEYFALLERIQPIEAKLSSFMLYNWNSQTNQTQAQIQWVYKGHEAAARAALAPIHAFGLLVDGEGMQKWNTLVTGVPGIEAVCEAGLVRNLYSFNLRRFDAASYKTSFDKIRNFFAAYPEGRGSVLQFEFFPNQAMAAVPANETAFPWRDTTGYINFNIIIPKAGGQLDAVSDKLGRELRKDLVAGSGYPELTVFVNYAHGDEPIERIYGVQNLPRLATLKKKWDPSQVFSYNNGLPLKYP